MKKSNYFLILLLFACTAMIGQTTFNIDDPEDLTDLNLSPGDEVVLANGRYSTDERIKFLGNGTANNPITFRPETPGGVVFTGGMQMNIGGQYLIVDGFYWNGGFGASNFIQFRDGTTYAQNSTIKNCAINGLRVNPDDSEPGTSVKHRWIVLYGNFNTITNCSFLNKTNAGATVLVELEFNAEASRCTEVGHTISNNYFYNYEKIDRSLTNSGDSETIRVGTSEYQNVNCATTVSNNYFVKADGENEIISNKSRNNIYTNNTFRRCRGSLVLRHGAGARVQENIFLGENVEGTGGIRITDSDHIITNNYIQGCTSTVDPANIAKWNNGITFMGGGDNSVTNCNSTSVSNGYQRSEDIIVSNNTIVNTNAPLFYNAAKGKNDLSGIVADNLIYYNSNSNNITDVISGDEADAFSSFGATLSYDGNVYNNTNLGENANGFTSSNLSSSNNGELLNISGANGKGANLNGYEPTTDNMVGNGIGACFLSAEGNSITSCNGTTPTPINSLTVSSINEFDADGGSQTVTVRANIDWTVSENTSWISVNRTSGSDNGTVAVSVSENTSTNDRSATITIAGSGISRTINVRQEGADDTSPTTYTAIPALIQAEDYDTQSGIRTENTSDNGGGENVGFIDTGDFLTYNINAPSNGDYTINFRVASRDNGTNFDIFSGNSIIGSISSGATGGWQTWETVSETVTLSQGDQTIRLVATARGWNINWLDFSREGGNTPSCSEGTNLSLNGAIVDFSTEQNSTNTVENIIDGDDDNRWSAMTFPQNVVIDLGTTYNVNEINLLPFSNRAYQFLVEGSTTSASSGFSTLTDATDNTSGGSNINRTFSSQNVRYVRLTITGASGYTGPWVSIEDFEVICAGTGESIKSNSLKESNVFAVTAFPNPYTENITISVNNNSDQEISSIELSDLSGRIIIQQPVNANEVTLNNLGGLSQGIYLIKVLDSNNNKSIVKVSK